MKLRGVTTLDLSPDSMTSCFFYLFPSSRKEFSVEEDFFEKYYVFMRAVCKGGGCSRPEDAEYMRKNSEISGFHVGEFKF